MSEQSKRGGKREGAGRKPSLSKYRGIYIKLPPEVFAWLREYRERTGNPINTFIVEAVKSAIATITGKSDEETTD